MPHIIVERLDPKRNEWNKTLLNTELIAMSCLAATDPEHGPVVWLTLTQTLLEGGRTISVKGTLQQICDAIARAHDKDYEAPIDLDSITAEWAVKLAKERR